MPARLAVFPHISGTWLALLLETVGCRSANAGWSGLTRRRSTRSPGPERQGRKAAVQSQPLLGIHDLILSRATDITAEHAPLRSA